jgi:chromosome segregation ATPase
VDLGLLAAVAVSPFVFMAVKGILGIGLAILLAWGTGIFVTQVMPALSFIISNYALKLVKWGARTSPIETLQGQYIQRQSQLADMNSKIADFDTNVRTFASKVKGLKEQFPNDATEFDQQLAQLQALLAQQRRQYIAAQNKLQMFAAEITKAKAKWEVAMAAQGAFKSAGRAANNVMDTIKRETALDSVELELNRAFAELNATLDKDLDTPSATQVKAEASAIRRVGVAP